LRLGNIVHCSLLCFGHVFISPETHWAIGYIIEITPQ
jgi:hypothetical protein